MAAALEEAYGSPSSRRLAACSSGYWILSPVGGDGYPVLGVPDWCDTFIHACAPLFVVELLVRISNGPTTNQG